MNTTVQDIDALKCKLRATWTSGDYGRVARGLEPGAASFLARILIRPGERVLDVACGAGQVAIPAARAGAVTTGIDIAENWIAQARARAAAEGLDIRFDVGDAEDMPYDDGAFDLVVSLIGAMFAPRPERVASELLRVCRPGGRIVMGNWTPDSFVGKFFEIVGAHVPPPPMPSPLQWGEEANVRDRLGHGVRDLRLTRRPYRFHYRMAPHDVVAFYRAHFGPVKRAFAALDEAGQDALWRDLERLWASHNEATDGTTRVDGAILEVVAVKA